jgi:hypothetical protein
MRRLGRWVDFAFREQTYKLEELLAGMVPAASFLTLASQEVRMLSSRVSRRDGQPVAFGFDEKIREDRNDFVKKRVQYASERSGPETEN